MASIKKYTKKDGSIAYQFQAYLGIDPLTGKRDLQPNVDLSHCKKQKLH